VADLFGLSFSFDLSNLFAILVIFAGVATLQFFYGRKLNLVLMRNVAETLEEVVKPKDQLYTWLGGYIGFKVEYEVDDPIVEKIEATLTLLPRHSIMYLPVSKVTLGGDRLFLVVRSRHAVKGDVHAIKKGTYRLSKGIDNEIEYLSEVVAINGAEFQVFYKKRRDKDKLLKHLSGLPVDKVKHISVTPSTRVIYAFVVPDKRVIEEVIPRLLQIAREFTEF
jgi:hypothetical protein